MFTLQKSWQLWLLKTGNVKKKKNIKKDLTLKNIKGKSRHGVNGAILR